MVEAAEAQAMAKGSPEIVTMIGPATLRSIETTETAVTAMIARNRMKDTDVAEMHTETGKNQKRKGGRPGGSLTQTAGKTEMMIASEKPQSGQRPRHMDGLGPGMDLAKQQILAARRPEGSPTQPSP